MWKVYIFRAILPADIPWKTCYYGLTRYYNTSSLTKNTLRGFSVQGTVIFSKKVSFLKGTSIPGEQADTAVSLNATLHTCIQGYTVGIGTSS